MPERHRVKRNVDMLNRLLSIFVIEATLNDPVLIWNTFTLYFLPTRLLQGFLLIQGNKRPALYCLFGQWKRPFSGPSAMFFVIPRSSSSSAYRSKESMLISCTTTVTAHSRRFPICDRRVWNLRLLNSPADSVYQLSLHQLAHSESQTIRCYQFLPSKWRTW